MTSFSTAFLQVLEPEVNWTFTDIEKVKMFLVTLDDKPVTKQLIAETLGEICPCFKNMWNDPYESASECCPDAIFARLDEFAHKVVTRMSLKSFKCDCSKCDTRRYLRGQGYTEENINKRLGTD